MSLDQPPAARATPAPGWDAEDMEMNVRQVRASEALGQAAAELAERAVSQWRGLDQGTSGAVKIG